MKTISVICLMAVASVALAAPPAIPATPASVDDVVHAQTFTLNSGFTFQWSKEAPTVTTGTLLVLKVDRALVIPRQVAEPVLYVGDSTAQRINFGHESGYVIAIVPGVVDLTKAPIWFGTPELPERVDAATVQAERTLANRAGIKPFSAKVVKAASERGGAALNVADMSELLRTQVSDLILKYSPPEKHLAAAFRVPVTTR